MVLFSPKKKKLKKKFFVSKKFSIFSSFAAVQAFQPVFSHYLQQYQAFKMV